METKLKNLYACFVFLNFDSRSKKKIRRKWKKQPKWPNWFSKSNLYFQFWIVFPMPLDLKFFVTENSNICAKIQNTKKNTHKMLMFCDVHCRYHADNKYNDLGTLKPRKTKTHQNRHIKLKTSTKIWISPATRHTKCHFSFTEKIIDTDSNQSKKHF